MIYRTSKSDIAKYREDEALSQSDLKKLLEGLSNFLKEDIEKQSLPMIIGSAVDTILTGYPEDFEKEFYMISTPKPSELMESMLLAVYEAAEDKNAALPDLVNLVQDVVINYNYQSNWKIDTRVSKVVENFIYYEEIKNCAGKTVLSPSDVEVINNVVSSLRTNFATKDLFCIETPKNVDIYYQLPIFWEINGRKCKGLLDMVVVEKNYADEVISVTPYDLKTTFDNTLNFCNNLKIRRYDIQASWYNLGLQLAKNLPFKITPENYKKFRFVVESTTKPGEPLVYECSNELLMVGYNGLPELEFQNRLIRKKVLGFKQLLDLYDYYENQGWQREQAIEESNSLFILNWDFASYTYKENEDTIWKKI